MPNLSAELSRLLGVGRTPYSADPIALEALGQPDYKTAQKYVLDEAFKAEELDKMPQPAQEYLRRSALSMQLAQKLFPNPPAYGVADRQRRFEIDSAVIVELMSLGEYPL